MHLLPNISILKKNYFLMTLYQMLTFVAPLITTPYVSRVLGADGVGTYSYTQSYMTYFTLLAGWGTVSYGTREIATVRNNKKSYTKVFWEIEILSILTTCICLIGWFILTFCYKEYQSCFLALVPFLLSSAFDISWFYNGHEQIKYTIFTSSISKIICIICIFSFVKSRDDLVLYIFINSFSILVGNLSPWFFLPRFLEKFRINELQIILHFRKSSVYFLPSIATSIYTVLDKTLIGLITHDQYSNGYYEQATKINRMIQSIVFISLNSVVGARSSHLFAERKIKEMQDVVIKSVDYILLMGIGASFGLITIAPYFIPLFLGQGYEEVVSLIYFMSPLIIIVGISNCLGSLYYTPVGLRFKSAQYIICGSIINLFLNLLLIPKYGPEGAVIGSLLAESIITILYIFNCNGFVRWHELIKISYKRFFSSFSAS